MVWLWYEVTHKITDFFTSSHNEDSNRMNQIKETHKLTWKYCERIWSSPFNGVVHTRRAWNKCTHTHTDHSSTAYSDHSAGSANCALWLRLDGQLTNSVLRNRSNRNNNWTVTVPGRINVEIYTCDFQETETFRFLECTLYDSIRFEKKSAYI